MPGPAERKALWTLAVDDGLVRAPFVAQLSANAERMLRYKRQPWPVLRALGLSWAQVALGAVLAAIKAERDIWALQPFAEAVQALPPLDAAQAEAALKIVRSVWPGPRLGTRPPAGPRRLVAVLPRESPEGYVEQIVEALKYPTSAGYATDVLLDALHGIDPKAPGNEAGLAANLAWLTTAYPAINLDAPPACPPPLPGQQDVACPDGGA